MKALVMEEVGKPMLVKDWPEPKCPSDGAIVRAEGAIASPTQRFGNTATRSWDSLPRQLKAENTA